MRSRPFETVGLEPARGSRTECLTKQAHISKLASARVLNVSDMASPARIYTIGHSTRSLDELVLLLREHAIELVVDVRRFPGSRRHPHFAKEALARSLPEHGIRYEHEIDLGGRRAAWPDSRNTAWRNAQFRGYAEHMASAEFKAALERLIATGAHATTAVMCAEQHPSRCHRRLLSDALVVRGVDVEHILAPGKSEAHALNPEARVEDGEIVYPAQSAASNPAPNAKPRRETTKTKRSEESLPFD